MPLSPVRHSRNGAVLLLLLAAIFWGSGNVANKTLLAHIGPYTALYWRCVLAVAVMVPFLWLERGGRPDKKWLASALLVAMLFMAAVIFQQIAYRWTTVTNVSFLVNTCSIITPVLAWMAFGHRPGRAVALAGAATLCGAFLMSGAAEQGFVVNPGDLACLLSALFYAAWMIALGRHMLLHGRPIATSILQFGLTAVVMAPTAIILETPTLNAAANAWRELVFLGVFSTAGACVLTTIAQRHVSASVAAVVVSAESVFGAMGAFALLGERVSPAGMAGGALILVSVVLAARTVRCGHAPTFRKTGVFGKWHQQSAPMPAQPRANIALSKTALVPAA